jgi:4-amino-4-deoxy-L-arabinose transferase-like glycosyltransferase
MVAAPIRAGLLPHDEFGLRFWDAAMGAAALVYVFLLATRLSNALGGLAAASILFVHWPLVFMHGLRSNNMEAALTLSYAGGFHHYLAWVRGGSGGRRRVHLLSIALFFVLAFMTKFVAALFFPLMIAVATVGNREIRSAARRDWRVWMGACAFAAAVIVPWFVYEHLQYHELFWRTLVGVHVYQRFTASVDPAHLHPWSYYLQQLVQWLQSSGTLPVVAAGLALFLFQAAMRRRFEAAVMLMWAVLPLILISLGTSKLYHYEYPFLAPLAIAAGVAIARAVPVVDRWLRRVFEPMRGRGIAHPALRRACAVVAIAAFAVAVVTLLFGPIEIAVGGYRLLKNGAAIRPSIVCVAAALAAGHPDLLRRMVIPILVLAVLPLPAYRDVLRHLEDGPHPLRASSACIAQLQQQPASPLRAGLFVDATDQQLVHPPFYYFRRIQPWERPKAGDDRAVAQNLGSGTERAMLLSSTRYRDLVSRGVLSAQSPAARVDLPQLVLVLPGSYAACAAAARHPGS